MEQTVFVDDRGVWSVGSSGRPYGIEWGEIVAVGGHKLDGITEVYTVIALDFEYGEFFEFDDTMPGFAEAVGAITQRLPGIAPDWFERVRELTVDDAPIEVWKK